MDEWWAFYRKNPFGISAWKTRLAYGFHHIAAGNYGEKFSRRKFMEMDPFYSPPPIQQGTFEEQMRSALKNIKRKHARG